MISRTMHCDFEGCKATGAITGDQQVGESIYPPKWRVVSVYSQRPDIHFCPDHRVEGILKLAVSEEVGFVVR